MTSTLTDFRVTHLRQLEAESTYILREVAADFARPVLLYSIGKDSSVMLHLARKAFHPSKPPFPLLLTGLSGSGKTTLAHALETRLFEQGRAVTVLDGQNLRLGISRDLGFSADERSENLRRAAEIAKLMNDAGLIVLAAFVAPQAAILARVRELIGPERVRVAHLSAPAEVCRSRDKTGRYAAAERGEIQNFPGVSAPYEAPPHADVVVPTHQWPVEQCVERLLAELSEFFRCDDSSPTIQSTLSPNSPRLAAGSVPRAVRAVG
jgi:adenylyl-sulfate kinase